MRVVGDDQVRASCACALEDAVIVWIGGDDTQWRAGLNDFGDLSDHPHHVLDAVLRPTEASAEHAGKLGGDDR
jgi:hypothetical protein